jgi:hypothetical protein
MGCQYLELAHILLLVYDPNVPRVGPAYRNAVRVVDVCLYPLSYSKCACAANICNTRKTSRAISACCAESVCPTHPPHRPF